MFSISAGFQEFITLQNNKATWKTVKKPSLLVANELFFCENLFKILSKIKDSVTMELWKNEIK